MSLLWLRGPEDGRAGLPVCFAPLSENSSSVVDRLRLWFAADPGTSSSEAFNSSNRDRGIFNADEEREGDPEPRSLPDNGEEAAAFTAKAPPEVMPPMRLPRGLKPPTPAADLGDDNGDGPGSIRPGARDTQINGCR